MRELKENHFILLVNLLEKAAQKAERNYPPMAIDFLEVKEALYVFAKEPA